MSINFNTKFWKLPENQPFVSAYRKLKRVGTAHAKGDALRAMYAWLVVHHHPLGDTLAPNVFRALVGDDRQVHRQAQEMLSDWKKASDAAWGDRECTPSP